MNKINRYERKWIFKNINELEVTNILLRSNLLFRFQYDNRSVNSIYFDDLNYSSIKENLDGVAEKKKYRIRWYGEKDKLNNPKLEIKTKKGFQTNKKVSEINELNNMKFLLDQNIEKIEEIINNKLNLNKRIFPLLSTHYNRDYFISNNGLVRATVDYDLASISLSNNKDKNIIKNYNRNIILELKYDIDLDNYVRNSIKKISMRLSRNSKFINSAISDPFSYS